MTVTINAEHKAALDALVNDPRGGVARQIETITWWSIEPMVKKAIGIKATYTLNKRGQRVWQSNPPNGPPLSRTGNLVASVATAKAKRDAHGLHVDVTVYSIPRVDPPTRSNPSGRVRTFDYAKWLVEKDYFFVSKGPEFKMVPRPIGQ